MKLILEAIKSLFRGVNGRIQQTAAALGKRIDSAQTDAKSALTTAKNAQTKANAAQTAAELAAIPICQATSTDGKTYDITLDAALVRNGQVLIIVPDRSNTSKPYLRIHGTTYSVYRYVENDMAGVSDVQNNFFWPGRPAAVILGIDPDGRKLALLLGFTAPQ